MPNVQPIFQNWKFSLSDHPDGMKWNYDDSAFETVRIPHDWGTCSQYDPQAAAGSQGTFLTPPATVGWYRKKIFIRKEQLNHRLWVYFDGIMDESTVYLNEQKLGFHPYGSLPSVYEITNFLQEGINLLAVRADCSTQPSSRWYNGCGIIRHAWLLEAEPSHVVWDQVFARTVSLKDGKAEVKITADLILTENLAISVSLKRENQIICQTKAALRSDCRQYETTLTVSDPALWSPENPALHTLEISLLRGTETADRYSIPFGIRKVDFIPQKGMFLNGRPIKMKGMCLHHDIGVLGAAVTDGALRRRLLQFKKMGCNAIRTSHNPQSTKFYTLCDQLGLMVMDEAFDGWEMVKSGQDYGRWFEEYHERDLRTFILRDRNHPSVVIWSIGNEVRKQSVATTVELQNIIHELDDTRPVTCGIGGTGPHPDECRAVLDVAGYNDGGGACFIYERDHAARPDQLMVATESPHTLQTRGFYRTRTWWRDKNQPRQEIENLTKTELFTEGCSYYQSSYDNAGVRVNIRDCWQITKNTPYLIGEFRWAACDYYGEAWEWPMRGANCGIIDTANFPKDSYYLYQAIWLNPETDPMVHILPHWTHPQLTPGTMVPVFVYSNCKEVELFQDGVSLGRQKTKQDSWALYNVPWRSGKLKAKAFHRGNCAAETVQETASAPVALHLENSGAGIPEDDWDEPYEVHVSVQDESGIEVPWANTPVLFIGNGVQIIGTENGDIMDLTPIQSACRRTFFGKCMAMAKPIAGKENSGITAVSILGRRYFEAAELIHLAAEYLPLSGEEKTVPSELFYCVNDGAWQPYQGPFQIQETSEISVRVFQNGAEEGQFSACFIRGKAPSYVDQTHGNEVIQSDRPVGPFAKQLVGTWADGEALYSLSADGRIDRLLNGKPFQQIGWWWYNYPIDLLESEGFAGTGEIWFLTGEKQPIRLLDQEATALEIDNSQLAFDSVYGRPKTVLLTPVK